MLLFARIADLKDQTRLIALSNSMKESIHDV